MTLRVSGGAQAQVIVTTPRNAGAVLVQATGSDAHLAQLVARMPTSKGFDLDGAALWKGSEFVATADEKSVLRRARLAGDSARAARGTRRNRGRGRGEAPPSARARRTCAAFCTATPPIPTAPTPWRNWRWPAGRRDTSYVGITDHSKAAAYAGGLASDDLPVRRRRSMPSMPGSRHPGPQGRRGRHPGRRALDYDETVLRGSTSSSVRFTAGSA